MGNRATGTGNAAIRRSDPVTAEDLKHVTEEDFTELQSIARGYCRAVDATRSRKRMDGSATVARSTRALYGTDDVSDDVTQDAVLIFARRLREIVEKCEVAAVWVATREPCAWQYVRRDGETIIVTRKKIQYWAVRDAAAGNGYRLDVKPGENHGTPGNRITRADKLSTLAVTPYLSGNSAEIFRLAWGDGSEFPLLRSALLHAAEADNLGRAGVLGKVAQEMYGGPPGSSSPLKRARKEGLRELRSLSAALDAVRDEMVYRSTRRQKEE
ncbi:hypothetical protein [Streptomyces acidiscabies]|uniref:hypothetical protein n=1 Tax=Streptomyces acidiscabies TaxID=42234 RepID=UPI0038F7F95D